MHATAASPVGWDADPSLDPWSGFPALSGTVTADACVVGLGGSGLAAIDELVARGLSVVGVDAGRVAGGAAGRNGGFLGGGGAMSLSGPHPVSPELRAELYRATMAELDRLLEQLGPDVVQRVGLVRVAGLPGAPADDDEAADRAHEVEDCAHELAALRALGVGAQEYDGPLGRGYLNPDAALINPVRRAFGLAARLAPDRVRLFEHSPVRSVRAGQVTTDAGAVSAPVVIVAVDGRLDVLLPQLSPAVRTVRLQMLATAPVAERVLPCGAGFRWGYEWAQQDAAGRLLLGGGRDRFREDEETTEDQPTAQVQGWIESVAARIAGAPVTVTHRWAASVGYTQDQRALCVPVDDGVVACGGYSGSGNLVGPVAARAAVATALDGTVPPAYLRSAL
jgi:gamma-glutamylputrescine oxidase